MDIKSFISGPGIPGRFDFRLGAGTAFRFRQGARRPGCINVKSLVCGAVLAVPLPYYRHGEENRLAHYLEARGYTDVQIEHPNQFHCSRRWSPFSYRARSPSGVPVHGGACVFFYFYETTEPIGKKSSARG